MTTIVFRDGLIAADTQETFSDISRRCTKLFDSGDDIVGISGDSYSGMVFLNWWQEGHDQDSAPDLTVLESSEDFECLVWYDAKLFSVNRFMQLVEVEMKDYPFYVIGSGAGIALGALAMGATAREAVAVACEFDINSSGPIEARDCKGWMPR